MSGNNADGDQDQDAGGSEVLHSRRLGADLQTQGKQLWWYLARRF